MTAAFITKDFHGTLPNIVPNGCGYYRCYLPSVVTGSHMGLPSWDPIKGFGVKTSHTQGIHGYKTVVLKLLMDRWHPRQVELAKALGQRVIVDIDDYYQGLTPANKAWTDSHPDYNKISNRDLYERVIERADTLTVSTPFLLDYYNDKHNDVRLVRNGVNMRQFQRRDHQRKPVIGWVGAVNYRNNDLEQLREWLPDFLDEHDLKFHHAGHAPDAPPIETITGINPLRVSRSPLVPINRYAHGFVFDIGLVPLNNIPFNHAKSTIKGLEYSAAGIPFVASDLPEYRLIHEQGLGLIANTPDEWRSALTSLLPKGERVKTATRQFSVINQHTIEARAKEWHGVLTP